MFKDKKSNKKKYVVNWEEEKRLQQSFVKNIQEMQAEDHQKVLTHKIKNSRLIQLS
jgi:hypothetical protein